MVRSCCIKDFKSECYSGCNISFHRSYPKDEVGILYEVIPDRLENLAKQSIASWVASQVHVLSEILKQNYDVDAEASFSLLAQHVEHIRQYLAPDVIWPAFNDMAKEITRVLAKIFEEYYVFVDSPLEKNSRLRIFTCYSAARMLEVVFCKELTCLEMSHDFIYWSARFPPRDTFVHKTHLLTELTDLELYRFGESSYKDILQLYLFLEKLRLKRLSVSGSHCFTDNIMEYLIKKNNCIEELYLNSKATLWSNLNWFNKKGNMDRFITQLRNLRILRIYGTCVREKEYKTLLLNCEKLECLGNCDLASVLQLILLESGSYRNRNQKMICQIGCPRCESEAEKNITAFERVFGIKHYRSSEPGPTQKQLQRVVKMCPLLCDVEIYPDENRQALTELALLKGLKKLTLKRYKFYKDKVWNVLYKIGLNITDLKICHFSDLDKDALLFINSVCPNLETLELRRISFTDGRRDIPEFKSNIVKFVGRPSTALKRIYISISEKRKGKSKEGLLEILLSVVLSNSINVESIEIDTAGSKLTGNFMLDCLDKNPMTFLKRVIIKGIKMPRPVVDQFIQKCVRLQTFKCDGIIDI